MRKIVSPAALEDYRSSVVAERAKYHTVISVCGGPGCHAQNCRDVYEAFQAGIAGQGLQDNVAVRLTGCHGFCEAGPLAVIQPEGIFYQGLKPEDAERIVNQTLRKKELVEDLLFIDPASGKPVTHAADVPFYSKQTRKLLAHIEQIDPCNVDDFIAQSGYAALAKVLSEMTPDEVIDSVEKAGLRGRGGAGFLAARKWRSCRNAPAPEGIKYVLCNCDEGDPGAYMDRSLLEGNPHNVLEGMLIGAYAIGATDGYVYVRHEYPFTVQNLQVAIEQAHELNLLGNNILGSGFDFDVKVSVGGGAFVCGESTALMTSIEGRLGEPRVKHIHTAEKGLYNRPTNLNNVETWANVPLIIREGAEAYAGTGTGTSTGTKIFSLVGKVKNTGLVEVPLGMTLWEIVNDIGAGVPDDGVLKAVQTGGPSGGCIPASLLDTPVDFDRLVDVGSMMGSGGMIVMDENTCMVDLARYFLEFLSEESCGKCVPCREGLTQMLAIVSDITEGRGTLEQLELLEETAEVVNATSLCGLGQTAANPVLSTIRYFRDEYLAHIEGKKCEAGMCRALLTFSIDSEMCTGCMKCRKACPVKAIEGEKKQSHSIDGAKCEKCGICFEVCEFNAVTRM